MKVAVAVASSAHWTALSNRMARGIERCGDTVVRFNPQQNPPPCDAAVVWGWRLGQRFRMLGHNVLVMERGYVGDRFYWTSLGWNGLNGRAVFPEPQHAERKLPVAMVPWREKPGGYALIMGQVLSDMAVRNVNLLRWCKQVMTYFQERGWAVRFRPHPRASYTRLRIPASTTGSLAEDLEGAAFVVTWNSNSGVDAVMAGVPTIAMDLGSMAWEVASHTLTDPITMPDRTGWANRLAWKQWSPDELESGLAWSVVKGCMPCS